jgi:hypothetical protein
VRKGFEKDAHLTNKATQDKNEHDILDIIDGYDGEFTRLRAEQTKELARKYRSEVART